MNDQDQPTPSVPIASVGADLGDPFPATGAAARADDGAAASFSGRTPRKTDAIRAGMIVGTGLMVAMGAAVAMGASPSPAASGGQTPAGPGYDQGPGGGGPGGGPFGGFGAFGPGGRDGQGMGAGGNRMGIRGFGQVSVTAVDGSKVSLATDDGWTRTITVASATTITKGGVAATLADLAVGDDVRFSETRNSDGKFTITSIEIVLPRVAGTVTAVGSDTITITLRDGTSQAIKTTGTTAYRVEDADGKRSDVTVGSSILATGERAADGTLTASSVQVQLPHVMGNVTATTADTIIIDRRDGTTVTVHVGAATTFRVAGVDGAKVSDVKTGMAIVVEGTQRADGSIDARAIDAGNPGRGFGHGQLPGTTPAGTPSPAPSAGTVG